MKTWLVTGGAGFIGSNFVNLMRKTKAGRIVNLDKLTYAGHLENLADLGDDPDHIFVHGDIGDAALVAKLLADYRPEGIVNFAAESHVDRSISGPAAFVETNIVGTSVLLQAALAYWQRARPEVKKAFRFLHVSTDEVYGSLDPYAPAFTEEHPYEPNSPYAASKAAADHLVRAFHHTYDFPTLTTNCSNNYGPYQHPEKLIPVMILNARQRKPLPVYGDGRQVRDWLYVQDHCEALQLVLEKGRVGHTYNIGGNCERANIDIVREVCRILDDLAPSPMPHARLITHVIDRPGHDRRYAIDSTKMQREFGWRPKTPFDRGLSQTLHWYLEHPEWITAVCSNQHADWIAQNYERRGAGT
jgi:dTDP-glucose 4,6-dehydratase